MIPTWIALSAIQEERMMHLLFIAWLVVITIMAFLGALTSVISYYAEIRTDDIETEMHRLSLKVGSLETCVLDIRTQPPARVAKYFKRRS
jgi:hypothetical protein